MKAASIDIQPHKAAFLYGCLSARFSIISSKVTLIDKTLLTDPDRQIVAPPTSGDERFGKLI